MHIWMPIVYAGNNFEQNTTFTCREVEEPLTISWIWGTFGLTQVPYTRNFKLSYMHNSSYFNIYYIYLYMYYICTYMLSITENEKIRLERDFEGVYPHTCVVQRIRQ